MIYGMTQGQFLYFTEELSGDLRMCLTKEGRKELRYWVKDLIKYKDNCERKVREFVWKTSPDNILSFLLDDFMGNGWSWIYPEDIGALTSANIISNDTSYSEDVEFINAGVVYAYMDYQVSLEIEELYLKGHCTWIKSQYDNIS